MKTKRGKAISAFILYGIPVISIGLMGVGVQLPLLVLAILGTVEFLWLGVCIWVYQDPKKVKGKDRVELG